MWWLLKISIVLQCVQSVRILNLRVPEVIQYGTRDKLTLDCDFIASNVTGLVLKWFYMDKSNPVYQWIPPQKPQALGLLKNKLDLTFRVSHNPYTQHRALRVTSPVPELTGNYTCVVSTFLAEAERTKPMTIFDIHGRRLHYFKYIAGCLEEIALNDKTAHCSYIFVLLPERRFDMLLDRLNDGYLNIICSVEGVFPRPELIILAGNRPLNAKSTVKLTEGRYTAITSAIVRVDSLPPTVEILCDMQVPLANYFSRKRDIFYRDPPSTPSVTQNSGKIKSAPSRGHRFFLAGNLVVILSAINLRRLIL